MSQKFDYENRPAALESEKSEIQQMGDAFVGTGPRVLSQEVSPGYKRTEVGVIPEDWAMKRLGDIALFFKGSSLSKADLSTDGKRRCIHYGELFTSYGERITEVLHGTDREGDFFCSVYNDVLMPTSDVTPNGLATASCVLHSDIILGGDVLVIRTPEKLLNGEFLAYAIRMHRNQVLSLVSGTTVFHLYGRDMATFRFSAPSVEEQSAIAEVLSDVDGVLAALEALIAKKRAVKQAAMQQLLTGKIRLPGFAWKWEMKRLGDIAKLHRQNVVPTLSGDVIFMHFSLPAYDEGQSPVIEPGNRIGSNKFYVPDNAILVSKLNPRIPRVWAPVSIGSNSVASTEFLILTPKECTSRSFLFVLCMSPGFFEQMELLATGTTGSHQRISSSEAMKIKVVLPVDVDEQSAIAAFLSDMDAEIAILEHRRDKTHVIKQSMMQQLLTGRVRLVMPKKIANA